MLLYQRVTAPHGLRLAAALYHRCARQPSEKTSHGALDALKYLRTSYKAQHSNRLHRQNIPRTAQAQHRRGTGALAGRRHMELFNTERQEPGCLDRAVTTIICDREVAAETTPQEDSSSSGLRGLPGHRSYQCCEHCNAWKLDNQLLVRI